MEDGRDGGGRTCALEQDGSYGKGPIGMRFTGVPHFVPGGRPGWRIGRRRDTLPPSGI
jgi:hypothetical protein